MGMFCVWLWDNFAVSKMRAMSHASDSCLKIVKTAGMVRLLAAFPCFLKET
jgi:hypothetical protein